MGVGKMRQFFYNLFRKPANVVAVINPVEEFRRELGLNVESAPKSWLMRIIEKGGTGDSSFLISFLFATFFAIFNNLSAPPSLISIAALSCLAVPVGYISAIVMGMVGGNLKTFNYHSTYTYSILFWLTVSVGVGMVMGHMLTAPLPLLGYLLLLMGNGLRLDREQKPSNKTAEEQIAELFDNFVAEKWPELVNQQSKMNLGLADLTAKASKLKDLVSRYEGELKVESTRPNGRAHAIEAEILRINEAVASLEAEKMEREQAKSELISAMQVFEAIKADATSYVRFESLSAEADQLIGDASRSNELVKAEIERIKGDIVQALIRMNAAAERLGLAAVAKLDDPDMEMLQSGSERVVENGYGVQEAIHKLSVVA